MTHESIHLDFSDPDMAQALADATPPDGVKVSGPSTFIQAAAPAQILTQIVIEFIPSFSATFLAGWILLALEKRHQKRTRINRKEVALEKDEIVRLIQEQLVNQKAREVQWKEDPNNANEAAARVIPNREFMSRPIEIFFSYAHEDEALMDEVRRQLIGYDRRKIIRKWHDRLIAPGTEWRGQIDGRLHHSDIILLFISPHFIASDYCYEAEMTEAMRRHESQDARVIPVILRPCLWHEEPFGRLQAVPTDGRALTSWPNRDEGALDAAKGIMKVVRELIGELSKPNDAA